MSIYAFFISFFLTLVTGLKLIAFVVHHHAAVSSGKYKGVGSDINTGITFTSIFATATMVFHYFI